MDGQLVSVCISTDQAKTKEENNYRTKVHERMELTVEEFARLLGLGHSFCNHQGARKGATTDAMSGNGFSSQYIALDMDGDKKIGIFPTLKDKISVRSAFCRVGLFPTIEYETFSADDDKRKFRMLWILDEPITDEGKYVELSEKVNKAAEEACGIKADDCNTDITRLFNWTDKTVVSNPDKTYTIDVFEKALSEVKHQKSKTKKRKHATISKDDNYLCEGTAIDELITLGVEGYFEKYQGRFRNIYNNHGKHFKQSGDHTELPSGYREFNTPTAIRNGKKVRRILKDGEERRMWILAWSGNLSYWMRENPTLLDPTYWREHFLFVICGLILNNIDTHGLETDEIAEKIASGYAKPVDNENTKRFRFNKAEIIEANGFSQEEYTDYVRKNTAKINRRMKIREALASYDANKTLKENAKIMGISKDTLKRYLSMEKIAHNEERIARNEEKRQRLVEYITANKAYGAAGVWRLMEIEGFEFRPESRKTVYNIFHELGFDTKGIGKTNQIVNRNCEEIEEIIAKQRRDEKEIDRAQALAKKGLYRIACNTDDIDCIKEKIGGFECLLWGKNVCVPRGQ